MYPTPRPVAGGESACNRTPLNMPVLFPGPFAGDSNTSQFSCRAPHNLLRESHQVGCRPGWPLPSVTGDLGGNGAGFFVSQSTGCWGKARQDPPRGKSTYLVLTAVLQMLRELCPRPNRLGTVPTARRSTVLLRAFTLCGACCPLRSFLATGLVSNVSGLVQVWIFLDHWLLVVLKKAGSEVRQ